MGETLIIIIAMVVTVLLGRWALIEGQRAERQKKFKKNFNEHKSNTNLKI